MTTSGIRWITAIVLLVSAAGSGVIEAGEYKFASSSFVASKEFDDAVVGARIQSDGAIVIAVNVGEGGEKNFQISKAGGAIVRLNADGTKVISAKTVAAGIKDMAIDDADNIYVAAGAGGALKLSPKGDRIVRTSKIGDCSRIDAAVDGCVAAIADKQIHVFDSKGEKIGQAKGSHYTCDVAIDSKSRTVVFTGFRNARAFDGKKTYPVQICYIRGLSYDGTRKWTNYEWSTDRKSDRFLNKPTNNMADSRGDRCTIGKDGKLYVTFQVAGGNHIFRYSPTNIMEKVKLAGGDKYHQFYNSRAEHKCFFARYQPNTGKFLAGQQFCGRLSSGRANYVATKTGEITADESGRVYIVGRAASGLPLTMKPDGQEYTGGGFILVMSPDLKTRLLVTRTSAGKGAPHAADVRTINGKTRAVFGGGGMVEGMFIKNAIQPKPADNAQGKKDPKDAFFAVIEKQ
ncbi:MAG: hypothetical protein QGG42_12570 [Phycisphaerae bacterium]|jgi:hypothetical protein|nr:hypothetical protein [Phycisphaerae bacterium]